MTAHDELAADQLTLAAFTALSPARQAELLHARRVRPALGEAARVLVMLGRPRTCIPGLLAYTLALGQVGGELTPGTVWGAVLAFLVGFSGNLHNVYTDVAEDSRNLPGRVFLLYRLGLPTLRGVLVALNVLMAGSALCYGIDFFLFVVIGLIGLHQYSFRPLRMKARPVLGLYVFAQAVVGPFLIGWFAVPPGPRWPDAQIWSVLLFLLAWFVAKGLFKNVPDYYGDREAGLRTSATFFPSWGSAALAASAATVASYLCYPLLALTGAVPMRSLLAMLWVPVVLVQCVRLVRAGDGPHGNEVLRVDMVLSSAFLATVLVLTFPTITSAAAVLLSAIILVTSDMTNMDSRRAVDAELPERPRTPQRLFDRVARYYDTLNSLLSLGQDRRWRAFTAHALRLPPGACVLDLATGTGSLAVSLARRRTDMRVVGCDLNSAMLAVGRRRIHRLGLAGRVRLLRADAAALPLAGQSFDAVCVAFAIDDMADRSLVAAEIRRVLRPGGQLAVLELAVPEQPFLRRFYKGLLTIMAALGRARRFDAYRHLRVEILGYRGANAVRSLLVDSGFRAYRRHALTGGIAVLHVAECPGEAACR
ncbi:hypothetical protein GCM10012275_57170 [Longimycelium tulufanense]|uniref:Uncharacterized protein n=1 Tax=Longimycelium tulufanense TaxID=907463 RepID=A0A8J3CDU3_9PSEU|nr:ubiquinone/menaquinone biosynthesis methyltransferase [Longimycelium tulufanense]GGM79122.1 hypothetical protein GCM10012275_57170 [Longimycelium tulufanense]